VSFAHTAHATLLESLQLAHRAGFQRSHDHRPQGHGCNNQVGSSHAQKSRRSIPPSCKATSPDQSIKVCGRICQYDVLYCARGRLGPYCAIIEVWSLVVSCLKPAWPTKLRPACLTRDSRLYLSCCSLCFALITLDNCSVLVRSVLTSKQVFPQTPIPACRVATYLACGAGCFQTLKTNHHVVV